MSESELQALAAKASELPAERYRALWYELPLTADERHDAAFLSGLLFALKIASQEPEAGAARRLQEVVAVAAERHRSQQRDMERMRRETNSPEFFRYLEEETARIEAGMVAPISTEALLEELELARATAKKNDRNGLPPST